MPKKVGKTISKSEAVSGVLDSKLKSDFRIFLTLLWEEMNLPKPTNMQLLFADILQKSTARKLCLLGYRGFAKTYISVAYLLWILYCDPTIKVAIWASNQENASDSTQLMLRLVKEVPWLRHLAPDGDMDQAVTSFDVKGRGKFRGSSVEAKGITGSVTGTRADYLLVDDPETSSNGDTAKKRIQIDRAMNEASFVLTNGGRVIVLGTVHFDDSLYTRLMNQGYQIYLFPIAVPSEATQALCWAYYPEPIRKQIQKLKVMAPLDRFNSTEIELRLGTGLLAFERQCLVNPFRTSLSQKPLDLRRAIIFPADRERLPIRFFHGQQDEYMDETTMGYSSASLVDKLYKPYKWDDQMKPYDYKLMIVDPAGAGTDETALVVVYVSSGYAVLMHSEGLVGGATPENLQHIIEVGKRHKVNELSVEDNGNLGLFAQILRAEYHKSYGRFFNQARPEDIIPITTYHVTQNKEKRIAAALDPVINNGRLVIHPDALVVDYDSASCHVSENRMVYRLTYQLSYFSEAGGKLEHDDRIDALTSAVERLEPWLTMHPEMGARSWEDYIIHKAFSEDEQQFLPPTPVYPEPFTLKGLSENLQNRRTFL